MTKNEFSIAAKPVRCVLDTHGDPNNLDRIDLSPKEFSTGSVGWNYMGKVDILVDGKPIRVQLNINAVVIGSKEW